MKKQNKPKTSTVVLVIACIMISLYAAADFTLQYFTGTEVSPTLTTAWFAFWGGELACLAGIKISKVMKNKDSDDDYVEETPVSEATETYSESEDLRG